jgi:hypothetical protein
MFLVDKGDNIGLKPGLNLVYVFEYIDGYNGKGLKDHFGKNVL